MFVFFSVFSKFVFKICTWVSTIPKLKQMRNFDLVVALSTFFTFSLDFIENEGLKKHHRSVVDYPECTVVCRLDNKIVIEGFN